MKRYDSGTHGSRTFTGLGPSSKPGPLPARPQPRQGDCQHCEDGKMVNRTGHDSLRAFYQAQECTGCGWWTCSLIPARMVTP
jgi:hypothetical protein